MTIYSKDKDGRIIITFDSRWQYPEVFGYKPEDPQYKLLRRLWKEATSDKKSPDVATESLHPKINFHLCFSEISNHYQMT